MAFLEEATIMDPRFKAKVTRDEVWERLKEAAVTPVRDVGSQQNVSSMRMCACLLLLYLHELYFYLDCNNVHSNITLIR